MLDRERLLKPIRKLRKPLKDLKKVPSPEEVHTLRTRCRRLEAIVHACQLDETQRGRKLLRSLAPVRKAAGKVRDMDVLTRLASSTTKLEGSVGDEQVRLLEELGAKRHRLAKRLHRTAKTASEEVLRELEWLSSRIDRQIRARQTHEANAALGPSAPSAVALSLAASLSKWPKLKQSNLHPYRIRVKELRYTLELAHCPDSRLLNALERVKNAIGEWHDWCELDAMARELLGKGSLLRRIHEIVISHFERALKLATALQNRFFTTASGGKSKYFISSQNCS